MNNRKWRRSRAWWRRYGRPSNTGRDGGFSLIELLVVLLIMGLLIGVVGPRVLSYLGSAKTKTARLQIEQLSASLDLFFLDVGRYPSQQEGLQALVENPGGLDAWNGPYLRKALVPADPWGFEYHYSFPGPAGSLRILSLGADNQIGGEGENRDVSN